MSPITLQLNKRYQKENFNITKLGDHQILLGRRWLQKENPWINWKTGRVQIQKKQALKITKKEDAPLPKHQS